MEEKLHTRASYIQISGFFFKSAFSILVYLTLWNLSCIYRYKQGQFRFLAVQVIFICVYITNCLHFFAVFLSFFNTLKL